MVSTRGQEGKRAAPDATVKSPPATKRAKVDNNQKEKNQKTIEEAIKGVEDAFEDDAAIEKDLNGNDHDQQKNDAKSGNGADKPGKNAFDEVKADENDVKKAVEKKEAEKSDAIENNGNSVIEDPKRKEAMPSSILEKGIIYFFYRGRVNIEEPHRVDDIARSYIVLRPIPIGAKIGEGPLEDSGNARLLALPKKVLPKSHRDRFLVFVEKVNSTIKDLKEGFMKGSDYATQTAG